MSPQRVPGRPVEASTRCSLGPSPQLDSFFFEAQLVETEEVAGKYPRHGKGAVGGTTNEFDHFFIPKGRSIDSLVGA